MGKNLAKPLKFPLTPLPKDGRYPNGYAKCQDLLGFLDLNPGRRYTVDRHNLCVCVCLWQHGAPRFGPLVLQGLSSGCFCWEVS